MDEQKKKKKKLYKDEKERKRETRQKSTPLKDEKETREQRKKRKREERALSASLEDVVNVTPVKKVKSEKSPSKQTEWVFPSPRSEAERSFLRKIMRSLEEERVRAEKAKGEHMGSQYEEAALPIIEDLENEYGGISD
jgi:hypothetical protein